MRIVSGCFEQRRESGTKFDRHFCVRFKWSRRTVLATCLDLDEQMNPAMGWKLRGLVPIFTSLARPEKLAAARRKHPFTICVDGNRMGILLSDPARRQT